MYKLLIVDDEPLVLAGLSSMLNWSELNIEICGTAMNGQLAMDIIDAQHPDIVITDIKMPVMSGLELIKTCRQKYGNEYPAFIFLTSFEDFHMAKEALTAHASDYLVKLEMTPASLKESVLRALESLPQEHVTVSTTASSVDSFYDKFFIRLLHNLFDSKQQFELQSRDLNLDFTYDNYVCCYGELSEASNASLSSEKQMTLFSTSMQMISELLDKYCPYYISTLDIRHFAIIFCLRNDTTVSDDYRIEIKGMLEKIAQTLSNYYNITVRTGIGSMVDNPFLISESYQYARQACLSIPDGETAIHYEDFSGDDIYHNSFNFALFKSDLTKAFEEYDAETLEKTVSSICELFLSHPHHYVQAMDAACNILYMSISLLQDGDTIISGFFEDKADGYRSIYKLQSVEAIVDWLGYLSSCICEMFTERKKDYKHHTVDLVKKYIKDHINERLSLNEIAASFGISPNYLSQLFSKYNDMGFTEYINTTKINESKRLLMEENLKVYEVAEILSFESSFYFSKVFKKIEGISPTEYINSKFI